MTTLDTLDSQAAAGRALGKLHATLAITKEQASKPQQYAVRKLIRDAAAFLKQAGYTKAERDQLLKPFQLHYDPRHRTR